VKEPLFGALDDAVLLSLLAAFLTIVVLVVRMGLGWKRNEG
jgi:hypothetical protein